jgi:microcystin-dependent protein
MKINFIGIFLLLATNAFAAQPISFTYQGKALNAAGTAPLTSTVSFTLSITDPSSACILYQESQTNINLATTNGIFALQVGSNLSDPKRTANDPGLTVSQIFANTGSQLVAAGGSCVSGYTPSTGDVRKLHVVITPSSGSAITIAPDLTINSVPNSMVADTLQGSSLSQVVVPAGIVSAYMGTVGTCPIGYLAANGQAVNKSQYPSLATAFGISASTFALPDLRGQFLRGLDTTGAIDPSGTSRTVGSVEQDAMQGHAHNNNNLTQTSTAGSSNHYDVGSSGGDFNNSVANNGAPVLATTGPISDGTNGTPRTALETRPKNVAVNYCVKY